MKAVFMPNRPDDGMVRVVADFPQLDWTIAFTQDERIKALVSAEILVLAEGVCCAELGEHLRNASKLRWVQFSTAGSEQCVRYGLPKDIPITSGSGIKAQTVSEHAIALLLCLSRRLQEQERARHSRDWIRSKIFAKISSLECKTLVIVGYGCVGQDIARKAKAFDMRTIVVSRALVTGPNVDECFQRARLLEALPKADAVILCTEPAVDGVPLFSHAEFSVMKTTSLFVNVARGSMVDETALIAALREQRISGAALDVMRDEPLPSENPLWLLENIFISPHVSGAGGDKTGYLRFADRFADNLDRFEKGLPLVALISVDCD